MKITVIGGTGLIGSKVVATLSAQGHEAIAASPRTGVDVLTGVGLAPAIAGASVVVDVSDTPSPDHPAVRRFFTLGTRNMLEAETAAGVRHHVALSVVGSNWLPDSRYLRAKNAQEELIRTSGMPHSIVRATQFFEFLASIASSEWDGDAIRVAPALVQPVAAEDVAEAVSAIAVGPPANGVIEIAGPEQFRLDVFLNRWLDACDDRRPVVADQTAPFFGAVLDERDLLPEFSTTIGPTRLADWLHSAGPATIPLPPRATAGRV